MKVYFCRMLIKAICFFSISVSVHAQQVLPGSIWKWDCSTIQTSDLYKKKVSWKTLNCDGYLNHIKILKSLNINIITAPIGDSEIKFLPYQAQSSNQLAKLPDIANSLSAKHRVLAGINGGYFFRNDVANFNDNICPYKSSHPPKQDESMGDSLLQHDGKNFATNCAFLPGIFQKPRAALILMGTDPISGKNAPYITLVKPDSIYSQANNNIPDAIGAGPNLVTNKKLTVDDPDESLLPTTEYAANSAVGIINNKNGNPEQLVLFTVDGNDASFKQHLPGMNAFQMADFMLHYLKVDNALSMDQGGSTTLFVGSSDAGVYPQHVVSNSNYETGVPRSEENIRNIYDGLFVAIDSTN